MISYMESKIEDFGSKCIFNQEVLDAMNDYELLPSYVLAEKIDYKIKWWNFHKEGVLNKVSAKESKIFEYFECYEHSQKSDFEYGINFCVNELSKV